MTKFPAWALLPALIASGFLISLSWAGAPEGKRIFEAKRCSECHQTEGPARERTIKDQLSKRGPELWYAGSKFRKGFLDAWLKDPRPIRPLKYNSLTEKNTGGHPALDAGEAAQVADYLAGLKSPEVKEGMVEPLDNTRGRIIFIKKLACYGCHEVRVRGNTAGGLSGPTLDGAGKRLSPDWIYAYLSNPKVFKPVKDMPNYEKLLNEADMKALSAYVASFME